MFSRTGLFILLCCSVVAQTAIWVSDCGAAPLRHRRANAHYTTKSPATQAGVRTHTTNKPTLPKMSQPISTHTSKPNKNVGVVSIYSCSEYELFGVDFSSVLDVLPVAERDLLKEIHADYQPDYAETIAQKYPEVRPEVAESLVAIASSVHQQKSKNEIGKIIHEMPVPTQQLHAHEVLAINQELAPTVDPEEYRAVDALNRFRMNRGLRPCVIDLLLCLVSRGHSSDMKRFGFFSHTSPVRGKNNFSMRARQMGASASAENIYMGSTNGHAANNAWANSSGHRANMLGGFSRVGVGRSGGFFTQMFGR